MESCDKQLTDHGLPIIQVQTDDTPENQTDPIGAMTHLPSDIKVENSIEQAPTHQRLLKDFISENQSKQETRETQAIDEGYAWVVVAAAFLSYCSTGCLWTSFSVMYNHYVEMWDSTVSSVGLIISLYAAGLQFVGVFFGAAIEGKDVRLPGILGAVVSSIATYCAGYSPSVLVVAVFYGITGAGHSLVYLSVSSTVQMYFNLRRALASGITLTGYSMAGFIFPPLTRYLLDNYGWDGTLIIFCGVHMQNIWLCALLRPVTPVREQQQKQHGSVQTKKRFNCKKAAMEIIKHLALLKQTSLLLFLTVNLSFNIGYNGFFFHIVNKALFLGMEKSVVAFLPTVSAITNIIWRPLFGLVATLLVKYINNIVVYGIAFVLISISIFVFTLVHQFHWMVVILVVFGLASASMATVQHPTLVDLVGIKNITGGIALLMVFCGVGQIVASPFAGWIFEITEDYNVTYYVSASLVLSSAVVCFVIFTMSKWENKADVSSGSEQEVATNTEV